MINNLDETLRVLVQRMREYNTPRRPDAILKHPEKLTTGNLKFNALNIIKMEDGYHIFIEDGSGGTSPIAPYMPYTNEEWISPKWKGQKNPNEKWWEKAMEDLVKELADIYNGIIQEQ